MGVAVVEVGDGRGDERGWAVSARGRDGAGRECIYVTVGRRRREGERKRKKIVI